ncbi:hypothetical protein BH09ACT10_BH09ACT10_03770 [soil metagenome]
MEDEDFIEIYNATRDEIFAFAFRQLNSGELAKEVVSETFETVWTKREFLPDGLDMRRGWVFGIAKIKVRQSRQRTLRKHHDNRFVSDHDDVLPTLVDPDVAEEVVQSATGLAIWNQLDEEERELLSAIAVRGLSGSEGAEVLGVTLTAYTTRTLRLRQKIEDLQEALERDSTKSG